MCGCSYKKSSCKATKVSSNPTVPEIGETFNFRPTTVKKRLKILCFNKKLDRLVPYELTANQLNRRIATYVSLPSWYSNKPFLARTMIDEKWFIYRNGKCQQTVLRSSKSPASNRNKNFVPRIFVEYMVNNTENN